MQHTHKCILLVLLVWQGLAIGQTEANAQKKVIGFNPQDQQEVVSAIPTTTVTRTNYKSITEKLANTKTKSLKHVLNKVDKITLRVLGVYGLQDKLYVKLMLYNDGDVPYPIQGWDYNILQHGEAQPDSKEKARFVYRYNANEQTIPSNDSLIKMLVFDQFTLAKEERLWIQLQEKVLSRSPEVHINSKYINAPFPVKASIQ